MPVGDFVAPGSMAGPLPIGREARLLAGGGTLFYFVWLIINFAELVGSNAPDCGWWIGVGFAFWYLPDLVTVGFSRSWGRWPQAVALLLALALVMVDLVAYGSVWAPPLGWGVFSFTAFYYGLIGVSFILAAAFAVPG